MPVAASAHAQLSSCSAGTNALVSLAALMAGACTRVELISLMSNHPAVSEWTILLRLPRPVQVATSSCIHDVGRGPRNTCTVLGET